LINIDFKLASPKAVSLFLLLKLLNACSYQCASHLVNRHRAYTVFLIFGNLFEVGV